MKKSFLIYTLLTLIIGLGFSSCKKDKEYWVPATLDCKLPSIIKDGDFITSSTIRLRDITDVDQLDFRIIDIETKNSWIALNGDISRNDDFIIYAITINGVTLNLQNYVYNATGVEQGKDITFQNDQLYMDFMYKAMKLLNERGQINVSVRGWSRMSRGELYITLFNNLDVLTRE